MTLEEAKSRYLNRQSCLTNYPFEQFGDDPKKTATFRTCYILSIPTDKYAELLIIDGNNYGFYEVKIGYLE